MSPKTTPRAANVNAESFVLLPVPVDDDIKNQLEDLKQYYQSTLALNQ
jgi:hypothetical protein